MITQLGNHGSGLLVLKKLKIFKKVIPKCGTIHHTCLLRKNMVLTEVCYRSTEYVKTCLFETAVHFFPSNFSFFACTLFCPELLISRTTVFYERVVFEVYWSITISRDSEPTNENAIKKRH